MEDFNERSCRLCFSVIKNEDYEVIDSNIKDILVFLSLKLDFVDDKEHVICNVCSAKLFAAQRFKTTCLYTDNIINPYIGDTGAAVLPLDLREIYMKDKATEQMTDDMKVCRLCMEPIKGVSEYMSINEKEVNMILKFVPEMNTFIINEPVLCKVCQDSLTEHCNFLKQCSFVEQNTENGSNGQVLHSRSPVPSVDIPIKMEQDICVKIEDVDLEFEGNVPESIKTECMDINDEEIKLEREIDCQKIPEAAFKGQMIIHKDSTKVKMYKCANCNYESKRKFDLQRHMVVHRNSRKSQMYKCSKYNYTRHKNHLVRYTSGHKDPLEVQMYKCKDCNYETKRKSNLINHLLVHRSPSEVQVYKCEHCDFETKHRKSLKPHKLRHKHPSKVHMYKCETCNYESKFWDSLKRHLLMHKDLSEVQMYKCENCNYETRHRQNLNIHKLKHKNPSEVQMYKCDTCNYETKFLSNLKKHISIHKKPSEKYNHEGECGIAFEDSSKMKMYKCANCNYETKRKYDLKRHMFVHRKSRELQMYKCGKCNYETTHRQNLKKHKLRHKRPSEVHMYKCETCNYQSKLQGNLKRHMLIHKDHSEVKEEIYKCEK